MELMAVIQAMRHFTAKKEVPQITIITDSQYVMKGMTEWIKGWKAKNWIGSNKKPVKNRDLWEALDSFCQKAPGLKWQWVKGHSGDHFNEAVDQLAVSAIPKE
ncbi:Ribonuclease HI [compost metagenome]